MIEPRDELTPEAGAPGARRSTFAGVAGFLAGFAVAGVVALVLRYRRAGREQRQQIKWILPPFGLVAVGFLGMVFEGADSTFWVLVPGALAVPVAIAVATAAAKEGLAQAELSDPIQQVHDAMWRPVYPRIELKKD